MTGRSPGSFRLRIRHYFSAGRLRLCRELEVPALVGSLALACVKTVLPQAGEGRAACNDPSRSIDFVIVDDPGLSHRYSVSGVLRLYTDIVLTVLLCWLTQVRIAIATMSADCSSANGGDRGARHGDAQVLD